MSEHNTRAGKLSLRGVRHVDPKTGQGHTVVFACPPNRQQDADALQKAAQANKDVEVQWHWEDGRGPIVDSIKVL